MQYLRRAGKQTRTFTLFLSSGTDATPWRDRIETLLLTISKQFAHEGSRLRFEVDRWEQAAPQRAYAGTVNDIFVDRARQSDLTLLLLLSEVRPGTREEFEAVLETNDVQLAVIWLRKDLTLDADAAKVKELLEQNRDKVYYGGAEDPESDEAWIEIVRVLSRFVASAVELTNRSGVKQRLEARP